MAKHFTYSAILNKSQGLHSPIYFEPERPVTKETLTPCDWGWGLPSSWGHVCRHTSVLTDMLEGLHSGWPLSSFPGISGQRKVLGTGEGNSMEWKWMRLWNLGGPQYPA